MRKQYSFLSMIGLLLMALLISCAPAAPATTPTPTPTPKPTQAPAPLPTQAPTPAAPTTKRAMVEIPFPQGAASGGAYRKAVVLSELLRRHSDFVRVTPMAGPGIAAAIAMYLKGQTTIVLTDSQGLFDFVGGTGPYAKYGPQPRDRLQNVLYQGDSGHGLVVRADSGIYSVSDLKGKKLALPQPGSAGYSYALHLLAGAGLDMAKDVRLITGTFADNAASIKEGSAQAIVFTHMYTPGVPYPSTEDVANSVAMRFISVTPDHVAKMNKAIGGEVYFPLRVPSGHYKGQKEEWLYPVQPVFWAADKNLSTDVTYEISRVWFTYYDEALELSGVARDVSPERNKEMVKREIVVPWHPGTLKYWKEKGAI